LEKAREIHLVELTRFQNEYDLIQESGIKESDLLVLSDLYRRLNQFNSKLLHKEVYFQSATYRVRVDALKKETKLRNENKRLFNENKRLFNEMAKEIANLRTQIKLMCIKEGVETRAQKRQKVVAL
jgi:hypothetical protein